MSDTYENILERMSEKYTELTGFVPEEAADIGIRLRLLAGEIYALSSNIEWLKQQMFPTTATGKQLDRHAEQRGLNRKKGNKASGIIIFKLDMPLEYDVVIPQGTICTVADGSLNYLTKNEDVIERGSTFAWIPCEAEQSGEQYNIGAETVNTIVTYFSVGISVHNATSFSGGTDDESDDELRKRLIGSYYLSADGVNAEYYRQIALGVEGIQSATVYPSEGNPGYVIVCLAGRGGVPATEQYNQAAALLREKTPLGIQLQIANTGLLTVPVSVNLSVKNGYTFAAVKTAVEQAITDYFLNLSVGEDLLLANLGRVIIETEGVENYVFDHMSDTPISVSFMAKLGTLTVGEI